MSNAPATPSPVAQKDLNDPGDATGRNFRYQYAYGVILLAAAVRRDLDYQAIWCEQQEDFLGEVNTDLFDAYQIKTQQPENGWWQHNSEPYSKSISRFVKHEKNFPGKIRKYFFVSNARPLDTSDKKKVFQSPCALIRAVNLSHKHTDLAGEHKEGFEYLIKQAELKDEDREALFGVLRRLFFPEAPDRGTFITAVAHEHVSKLEGCEHLNASQLDRVAEHLLNLVASSSALGSQDPSRHYMALSKDRPLDVQLQHKRIDLKAFQCACRDVISPAIANPPALVNIYHGAVTIQNIVVDSSVAAKKVSIPSLKLPAVSEGEVAAHTGGQMVEHESFLQQMVTKNQSKADGWIGELEMMLDLDFPTACSIASEVEQWLQEFGDSINHSTKVKLYNLLVRVELGKLKRGQPGSGLSRVEYFLNEGKK